MRGRARGLAAGIGLFLLLAAGGLWWARSAAPPAGAGPAEAASAGAAQAAAGAGAATSWSAEAPVAGEATGTAGAAGGEAGAGAADAPAPAEANILVHVAGAVRQPGLYPLPRGARLGEAVEAAGGLTEQAAADVLNLAAPLVDGVRVTVPTREQAARFPGWPVLSTDPGAGPAGAAPSPLGPPAASGGSAGPGAKGSVGGGAPLDLNRASADELDRLPGIGPSRAAAIVALREARGGFHSVDELLEVRGIGPVLFEQIRPLVRVGPP
ncbi:MAG: helix-hairpin-helix domain-containing protein [Bacillota bacterium]|nr:helix-hairpin-helix domain-containing protein [Bacillota bacterium]